MCVGGGQRLPPPRLGIDRQAALEGGIRGRATTTSVSTRPRQILHEVGRLTGVPAVLAHGRHDISSPPATAWSLAKAWPTARLELLDTAGHGGPGFTESIAGALAAVSLRA